LEEIGTLITGVLHSMKAVTSYRQAVFSMRMNYIIYLDAGIKHRSYPIQIDAAAPRDWLPLVHRMITAVGTAIPPHIALPPAITARNDNARGIVSAAVRVAISVQRESVCTV
jgi:hypothetical protein